jgi:hypothetical protein
MTLDLNIVRADFAAYLGSNASRRHSLDAALMHVVEAAYQKGLSDALLVPAVLRDAIPNLDAGMAAGNGSADGFELAAVAPTGISEDSGGTGQGGSVEGDHAAPACAAPGEALKGGALAKLAGMWCNDAAFQHWIKALSPDLWDRYAAKAQTGDSDHLIAGNIIRHMVGVKTRAELDHNAAAAQVFSQMIRAPYAAHLKANP